MFLVHNRPVDGPQLHRHPYSEIFIVHSGEARFELDRTGLTAGAGDVVIARPAGQLTASRMPVPASCR